MLAASAGGNIPLRHFLDDRVFQTSVVFAEYFDLTHPLPVHHIVFNAIGDADFAAPALATARSLLATTTAPVINQPDKVAATGRSDHTQRLAGIPGLVTSGAATYRALCLRARILRQLLPAMVSSSPFWSELLVFTLAATSCGWMRSKNYPPRWPNSPARNSRCSTISTPAPRMVKRASTA
jgi:hypothetical protein